MGCVRAADRCRVPVRDPAGARSRAPLEADAGRGRAVTKRVLMIAYLFPPIANSGTQRPAKFAKYLTPCGWEPVVLTVERPPNEQVEARLMHEVPAGHRGR